MESIPIAKLTPELSDLELKQFRAVVTLIWPFSSSTRQCAVLLADPDFRLRSKRGQVRVRFTGSSARAIAETGISYGDEVVLGLRGAQFVEEEKDVSTPGKSVDWELSYSQTVVVRISRDGEEVANLDILNAAPTPAPSSPVRQQSIATPVALPAIRAPVSQTQRWSSPAFLKHKRLSDGPFFEAGYDPLVQQNGDEPDKKRRRKSYRDWNAWTYSARTPSPEPVGANGDEDFDLEASPTHATTLPEKPTSPSKPDIYSVASLPHEQSERDTATTQELLVVVEDDTIGLDKNAWEHPTREPITEDFVRDADYYDLYAGPGEYPPDITQDYRGDTVSNTEEDTPEPPQKTANTSEVHRRHAQDVEVITLPEDDRLSGPQQSQSDEVGMGYDRRHLHEWPGPEDNPIVLDEPPEITMPPPTLPSLQTNFHLGQPSGLLTPIGREPQSPVLMPQDSSTLPMPSPFPGDRDGTASSYLDALSPRPPHSPATGAPTRQVENEDERDFIAESSFYNSGSTWNIPDTKHESAFTDVRFTFGMDGSTFSPPGVEFNKPGESSENSGLIPESENNHGTRYHEEMAFHSDFTHQQTSDIFDQFTAHDADMGLHEPTFALEQVETSVNEQGHPPLSSVQDHPEPDVIMLSSGSESESVSDVIEDEDEEDDFMGVDARDQTQPEDTLQEEGIQPTIDQDIPVENKVIVTEEPALVPATDSTLAATVPAEPPVATEPAPTPSAPIDPSIGSAPEVIDLGSSDDEGENEDQVEVVYRESNDGNPREEDHSFMEDQVTSQVAVHVTTNPEFDIKVEHHEDDAASGVDDLDKSLDDTQSQDESLLEIPETLDPHPDIKMESIEADNHFDFERHISTHPEAEEVESVSGPSADMLIQVPGEGNKVGELQWQAVPATGPARNTRSKTKTSLSPAKTDTGTPQPSTRSRRSKTSMTSATRDTASPVMTRLRSTASPPKDSMTESPTSLHFRSKMRSPAKIPSTAPVTRSSRRQRGSSDSAPLTSPLQSSFLQREMQNTRFEPSDQTADGAIPTARQETNDVNYPSLPSGPLGGQEVAMSSSPPPHANHAEQTTASPDIVQPKQASAPGQQPNLTNSNVPLTPQASQSFTQSQSSPVQRQQEHSLPMTPQLTQDTSASLQSQVFHSDVEIEELSQDHFVKPSVDETTPRRNVTGTDVASPQHSPSVHSEDNFDSSESETHLAKQLEPPSIGLSTPVSYYTPLRDLAYFINRSAQFHTSSNPDVLALVTSNTTPPKRAPKGPKQWNISLHITDLSLFPESRTVQVFRAYSSALPVAAVGDVVLLRGFSVKSLNRKPMLVSTDESSWSVWRYSSPVRRAKNTAFGEIRAREEVKGPAVETGEGEWKEVERIRGWYVSTAKAKLEEMEESARKTRSHDKDLPSDQPNQRETRSKGKGKVSGMNGVEGLNGDAAM
jgi:hypothetical protein